MAVFYDNNKLIPAPIVDINKEYIRSDDGQKLGAVFSIGVRGTILPDMGSPNSSGLFWQLSGYPDDEIIASDSRLKSILRKQEAIRDLFSTDGLSFEVQPWDGGPSLKCNPVVNNISFPADIWFVRSEYSINLSAYKLYGGPLIPSGEDDFDIFIDGASENWSIESNDIPENDNQTQTYRLTHNISAKGTRFFDINGVVTEPWENARSWVLPRIGLDAARITASGSLNLPSYFVGFNHARSEQVDELGGTYSITETWLLASGNVLEDFTVSITNSTDNGRTKINIEGSIQGMETRNSNFAIITTKWTAASGKFATVEPNILLRAQNYAGMSLNPQPLNKVIRKNPNVGNIDYSFEYDNRPLNFFPNAIFENISISYTNTTDVFASIAIPGRLPGGLLQDMNTITNTRMEINIDVIVSGLNSTPNLWHSQRPQVSGLLDILMPVASQVFIDGDSENWNPKDGIYNRRVSYTFQ